MSEFEIKVTIDGAECVITDARDWNKFRQQLHEARGEKYIKEILGSAKISPEDIIKIPFEEVEIGERIVYGHSEPEYRDPDLEYYYDMNPNQSPNLLDYYSLRDTDILILLHYDLLREKDLYGRGKEDAKNYREGKQAYIAEQINNLLQRS